MIQKTLSTDKLHSTNKRLNLNIYFSLSSLKKSIMDENLRDKIENIIKHDYTTKKNKVYGNYLLAKYEREKKNYEEEFNYLVRGHLHYFELEKEKFMRHIKHCFDVLPNINKLINLLLSLKIVFSKIAFIESLTCDFFLIIQTKLISFFLFTGYKTRCALSPIIKDILLLLRLEISSTLI